MSFNRSGYIGRAPGDSAISLAKQYFQPTGVTTDFTFSSGYSPGLVDVYRNGIKLINVLDYAATDGSTISLSTPVGVGSTVQVVAYKAFNLATVKATELDTSVTGTDLTLAGDLTVSSLATVVDINVSGGATVSGTLVANSFSGDGTGLTGVASTDNIITGTAATFRNTAVSAGVPNLNVVGLATVGILTAYGTLSGTVAEFSAESTFSDVLNIGGIVNANSTTDSTSSSTGALIVDGGLGVAKNVYIGAGLSVAGTLTYEDVTNVDSVGVVTAKSGVNISGGELLVGTAVTVGSAGVSTFSGAIHVANNLKVEHGYALLIENGFKNETAQILNEGATEKANIVFKTSSSGTVSERLRIKDDGDIDISGTVAGVKSCFFDASANSLKFKDVSKAVFGEDGDLAIYHRASNGGNIIDSVAGNLWIKNNADSTNAAYIACRAGSSVDLYHNGGKVLTTIGTGVSVYGPEGGNGQILISADEGDDNADKFGMIVNTTGSFFLQNYAAGSWANNLKATGSGSIDLYYNASKKFETTNNGTVTTGVSTVSNVRYGSGGGANNWNGNPRSVVIGYSGSDYAQIGMGWTTTGTNGQYISGNTDRQSRLELYDGVTVFGSGASVSSGTQVTWKEIADFKPAGIFLYHDTTLCLETRGDAGIEATAGNFIVGTSGRGLQFDTADSGSDQLLDDYEEGDFTPTLGHSHTAAEADGKYTKVGNMCIAAMSITLPTTSNANHLVLGSLPFTAAGGRPGSAILRYSNSNTAYYIMWHVNAGEASVAPYYGNGGSVVTYAEQSAKRFDLTFVYRTA